MQILKRFYGFEGQQQKLYPISGIGNREQFISDECAQDIPGLAP